MLGLFSDRAGLSSRERSEVESLAREKDPEMFFAGLLAFGGRLEAVGKAGLAAEIYSGIAVMGRDGDSSPVASRSLGDKHRATRDEHRATAKQRLDALQGRGHFGLRAEILGSRFLSEATDPKLIVPMLAGTFVGRLASTVAGGRLAQMAPTWLTRGWGARGASVGTGFLFEVPVFTGTQWALHGGAGDFSENLGPAGLTLGVLKFSGWAMHSLPFAKGRGVFPGLFRQAGIFGGLLTAHRLETVLVWRPDADNATTIADTLAAMASLSVGAHLGLRALGPRFAQFQNEMMKKREWADPFAPRLAFQAAPMGGPVSPRPRSSLIPSGRPLLMSGPKDGGGKLSGPHTDMEPSGGLPEKKSSPQEVPATAVTEAKEGEGSSLPQALVVHSGEMKKGGVRAFLHRQFGPLTPGKVAALTLASSLVFLPLAPGSALIILGSGWLAGKIALDLRKRLRELGIGSRTDRLLPPSLLVHSHTFRRDREFHARVEAIETGELLDLTRQAAAAELSSHVYLRRKLKGASSLEFEAWLENLLGPENWQGRIEWISRTQNPAGIPLLRDIVSAPALDIAIRKRAIDVLVELQAIDAIPELESAWNDPRLEFAAAGSLLLLDPSARKAGRFLFNRNGPLMDPSPGESEMESIYDILRFNNDGSGRRAAMETLGDALEAGRGERILQISLLLWAGAVKEILKTNSSLKNNRPGLLEPAVAEALVDLGKGKEVLSASSEFFVGFFTQGGRAIHHEAAPLPVLCRYARLAAKLGNQEAAKNFLRRKTQELKSQPEKDPQAFLTVAEAYVEIGEPSSAVPLLRPLLRHEVSKISLTAARLMDRAQPGWDDDITGEGGPGPADFVAGFGLPMMGLLPWVSRFLSLFRRKSAPKALPESTDPTTALVPAAAKSLATQSGKRGKPGLLAKMASRARNFFFHPPESEELDLNRVNSLRLDEGWSTPALSESTYQSYARLADEHSWPLKMVVARAFKAAPAEEVEAWMDRLFPRNLPRKIDWIQEGRIRGGTKLILDSLRAHGFNYRGGTLLKTIRELRLQEALPHLYSLIRDEANFGNYSPGRIEVLQTIIELTSVEEGLALLDEQLQMEWLNPRNSHYYLAHDQRRQALRLKIGLNWEKTRDVEATLQAIPQEGSWQAALGRTEHSGPGKEILKNYNLLLRMGVEEPKILRELYSDFGGNIHRWERRKLVEALVDRGEVDLVRDSLEKYRTQLLEEKNFQFGFQKEAEILAKIGERELALDYLRRVLDHPNIREDDMLEVLDVLVRIGESDWALRLGQRLLHNHYAAIRAADLMDQIQPGWDHFLHRPPLLLEAPYR